MKKTGLRKKTSVLILTSLLITTVFTIVTTGGGTDGSPLGVSKTVWDGNNWVEEIFVDIGDTVTFNITISNLLTDENHQFILYDMFINDTLPPNLKYANNATLGSISREPNAINDRNLTWFIPVNEDYINPGGNLTLLFNATVEGPGSGINLVNVTSEYCNGTRHTKEDNATVNVREPGDMIVTKTVKNATSGWLDEVDALVGETVRFNISILYTGDYNLTDFIVKDELPECLNYSNNAYPIEPDKSSDNKTLWWNLTDDLADGESIFIEFDALVVSNGTNINKVNVTAREECTQYIIVDEDNATVNAFEPEEGKMTVTKTVKNATSGWLDEVDALVGETVRFNITILYTGNNHLSNFIVKDELPECLNYSNNAHPTEPDKSSDNKTLWWNLTGVLASGERRYIEFDALVVSNGTNINNVNVTAEEECTQIIMFDEDNATVNAFWPEKPGNMTITKTVKNATSDWLKEVNATVGETVTFNISILYTGSGQFDLYDINVIDTLPDCLDYLNDTAIINDNPKEPEISGKTLWWNLSNAYRLEDGESNFIEFDALVISDGININIVNVNAMECSGTPMYGEDNATVNASWPPLEIVKKVWNATSEKWDDEADVMLLNTVRFNLTITSNVDVSALFVTIVDTLPADLTYANDATLEPFSVSSDKKIITWEYTFYGPGILYIEYDVQASCQINITVENFANITGDPCGHDSDVIYEDSDSALVHIVEDYLPPWSEVNGLNKWYSSHLITITADAGDDPVFHSGVEGVELWYNYSGDAEEGWKKYGTDTSIPGWSWEFNFTEVGGEGYYEFYSRAYDTSHNHNYEGAPSEPDATCNFDETKPESDINKISDYWHNDNPKITATASDERSGIQNVVLYYKYSKDNTNDWTDWTSFGTDTSSPYEWTFTAPKGNGYYRFCSEATDKAGNLEGKPETYDQDCAIDKTAPTVIITKPEKGRRYINDKDRGKAILGTLFGRTVIYGGITIKATATETLSGFNGVDFLIDSQILVSFTEPNETYEYYWNELKFGKHSITVNAHDKAGNMGSTTIEVHVYALGLIGGDEEGDDATNNNGQPNTVPATQQKITASTVKTTSSNLKTATTYQSNKVDNDKEVLSDNHRRSLTKV